VQAMVAARLGAGPAGALLLTLAPLSLPSLLMAGRVFPRAVLAAAACATAATGVLGGCSPSGWACSRAGAARIWRA
jgi:uncharacterized protein